jgi:uncharacterized protein YjiS (DUF1127 family)
MSTLATDKMRPEPFWVPAYSLLNGTLRETIGTAVTNLKARRAFRRAERQLMALDGRALKDIGLDRSEIRSALTDVKQERRNGVHPGR